MSNTKQGSHFPFVSQEAAIDSHSDGKVAGHEVATGYAWRRSTYSGATSNCVETAPDTDAVLVRDSKVAAGPVLELESGAWQTFIGRIGA
ncbi:DUF397 domain-containing protein [Embleya scabrispora]|uniref:DUF397 domain-containing protein n=1 Tax=Embleya scabrispora TaxID=159449 RepID=UPI001F173E4F|nr:DUF397 domain-containing protein [Embleya scabrispora]